MKYGIKRWFVRHMIHRQRCQSCGTIFKSSDLRWTPVKYGWNLVAYAMYQNIELHLPQTSIDSSLSKLFGLRLPRGWTNKMKITAAQLYATTHDKLVKKLCSGHLLHVKKASVDPALWALKDITIEATWCYHVTMWPRIIGMVERGVYPVQKVISAQIKADDVVDMGFKALLDPVGNQMKVLVKVA